MEKMVLRSQTKKKKENEKKENSKKNFEKIKKELEDYEILKGFVP